jgi:hypothetical protein
MWAGPKHISRLFSQSSHFQNSLASRWILPTGIEILAHPRGALDGNAALDDQTGFSALQLNVGFSVEERIHEERRP